MENSQKTGEDQILRLRWGALQRQRPDQIIPGKWQWHALALAATWEFQA